MRNPLRIISILKSDESSGTNLYEVREKLSTFYEIRSFGSIGIRYETKELALGAFDQYIKDKCAGKYRIGD